jgi:tetratricopeptide (TPR) repeat protein
MSRDPYASCSCGSGKKYRWCCEPIFVDIQRAFEQEMQGQHEAALRIMNEVVAAHSGNPEVHGQLAKLLYSQGKVEEAENALQKAFAINPNYPFGLLLRAVFRYQEGEFPGALLLARRAAEHYHKDARDFLAEAYTIIFECEMKLHRPIAARAALSLVLQYQPSEEGLRESFDALFGEQGRLPLAARQAYHPLPLPSGGPVATAGEDAPKLHEVAQTYERYTQEHPDIAAGWFNLGLTRACLGENRVAIEALDRYIERETNEKDATDAATLVEVLRCGAGLEEESDYHEYVLFHQISNPQAIDQMLRDWLQSRRLLLMRNNQQEGPLTGLLLEQTTASLLTVGGPAADTGRLAGYLLIAYPLLQITSPNKEIFDRLKDEIRQRLVLGIGDLTERLLPGEFQNVIAEALLLPTRPSDAALTEKIHAHAQNYYEEIWVNKPRHSLSGNTPIDASGHPTLRKKLRGVIQFSEECAKGNQAFEYDFNRLRRKLGLFDGTAAPAAAQASGPLDVAAMGTAELAALKVEALTNEQLEQAYQAAQKLDAEEIAAHFARGLVARPPQPDRPDQYPFYSYLTQHALKTGDTDAALDLVNEGEKADCERNEGKRRNEYELRRGHVHVKRGEADAAEDVFRRLIERAPAELKYRGAAAEAMLSLKQGARALRFAEEGLVAARQRNDRDTEQYLLELAAAAKKQM